LNAAGRAEKELAKSDMAEEEWGGDSGSQARSLRTILLTPSYRKV